MNYYNYYKILYKYEKNQIQKGGLKIMNCFYGALDTKLHTYT